MAVTLPWKVLDVEDFRPGQNFWRHCYVLHFLNGCGHIAQSVGTAHPH